MENSQYLPYVVIIFLFVFVISFLVISYYIYNKYKRPDRKTEKKNNDKLFQQHVDRITK